MVIPLLSFVISISFEVHQKLLQKGFLAHLEEANVTSYYPLGHPNRRQKQKAISLAISQTRMTRWSAKSSAFHLHWKSPNHMTGYDALLVVAGAEIEAGEPPVEAQTAIDMEAVAAAEAVTMADNIDPAKRHRCRLR